MLLGSIPADLATFAAASAIALVTAVAGSVIPAIRALRINPLEAIRHE